MASGGDFEEEPAKISGCVEGEPSSQITLKVPKQRGAYRLYLFVKDALGGVGHANFPFFVK